MKEVLSTVTDNLCYINTIDVEFDTKNITKTQVIERFQNSCHICGFGNQCGYPTYNNDYNWSNGTPHQSHGIYLGSNQKLRNLFNTKLIDSLDNIETIYFDISCKYPRSKAKVQTNLQRKRDPQKADVAIMDQATIFNIPAYKKCTIRSYRVSDGQNKVYIYYSKNKNIYYFIDHFINCYDIYTTCLYYQIYQIFYSSNSLTSNDPFDNWVKLLKYFQIIPNDCELYYSGEVVLLKSENETLSVKNLLNSYTKIMTKENFNKFITNNLPDLTEENFQSIQSLLNSNSFEDQKLGLQLLSSYDIQNYCCRLTYLLSDYINSYWYDRSVNLNLVIIQQVFESLKLTIDQLKNTNKYLLLNKAYLVSTSEEDKQWARNMIKSRYEEQYNRQLTNIVQDFYNMKFKFNITIE